MDALAFMNVTVEPYDILPLAALFLRWPVKTAEKINAQLNSIRDETRLRTRLTLYELVDIYYQDCQTEEVDYKGFILELDALPVPKNMRYCDYIIKFSDLYVLKEDISAIEKLNRKYRGLPACDRDSHKDEICTPKNLHTFAPLIMQRIFSEDGIATGPGKPEDPVEFTKKHLWPWFGPVITNALKGLPGRHAVKNEEEVAAFIQTARMLGQTESSNLAKMVKTRYPTFPHRNMVTLIEPNRYRDTGAAKKAATDWLK